MKKAERRRQLRQIADKQLQPHLLTSDKLQSIATKAGLGTTKEDCESIISNIKRDRDDGLRMKDVRQNMTEKEKEMDAIKDAREVIADGNSLDSAAAAIRMKLMGMEEGQLRDVLESAKADLKEGSPEAADTKLAEALDIIERRFEKTAA